MLTMTPNAESILAERRTKEGAPASYGVRFFPKQADDSGKVRLAFNFVATPRPADTIVGDGQLKAFVAPELDEAIGDVVVDVEQKSDGPGLVVKRVSNSD